MPRYLSDEYSANDERVERQPYEDKKTGAARQRSKKEVTDLLKADKEARKDARNEAKEAKSAPADNVAEEKEMRRARESVRPKSGGGGGGSDTREMQLGADLDPKAMMKKEGYKKGGAVKSASARADGIAIRGKTRA